MDFLGAVAAVLFAVLPERVAAAICTAVTGIAALIGLLWFNHERAVLTICNSPAGRLGQLFDSSASAGCGLSSLFKIVALVLMVGGGLCFLGFGSLTAYLLANPDKKIFE